MDKAVVAKFSDLGCPMAIEIEKKYSLTQEQYDQVSVDLEEYGAVFAGEDFEENNLYGNDFLKEEHAVLRIRKSNDRTILTYKRFVPSDLGVKQHIEYETVVEDFEQVEKIIEHLGLEKGIVYEKRRRTWNFRKVEVVLDELPFGLFMEIEGSLTAIAEAEMFLEAEGFDVEERTYPYLTKEFGFRIENRFEARFGNNNQRVTDS